MVIQIQLKGMDKTNQFLVNIPREIQRDLSKTVERFASFVQRSAKLRAPRFTGKLAKSIVVKKIRANRIEINVESPIGIFQEEGFNSHWIHKSAVSPSGDKFSDWLDSKGYSGRSKFFKVKKHTPFIKPALEAGLNRLPSMLQESIKRSIKNSGGK